jgi:hypothetical protein
MAECGRDADDALARARGIAGAVKCAIDCQSRIAMEAERLNQIAASLSGLRARTDDLRRYL